MIRQLGQKMGLVKKDEPPIENVKQASPVQVTELFVKPHSNYLSLIDEKIASSNLPKGYHEFMVAVENAKSIGLNEQLAYTSTLQTFKALNISKEDIIKGAQMSLSIIEDMRMSFNNEKLAAEQQLGDIDQKIMLSRKRIEELNNEISTLNQQISQLSMDKINDSQSLASESTSFEQSYNMKVNIINNQIQKLTQL